jgi:arginase family enzyme
MRSSSSLRGRIATPIHIDVDVVDFTDAALSEHPSRNTGVKLEEMLGALKILASGPGLVAITLTELNPLNAASDDGLLQRSAGAIHRLVEPRPLRPLPPSSATWSMT